MTLTLFSPAKINLFLRVLRKREDGYHELASLFQAISLGDTLTFSLSNFNILTVNTPHVPCNRNNLIFKALDAFRNKTGLATSLKVHLEKSTPLEAGLGGGSSNAATTLYALNELTGRPLSEEELRALASTIGADVAFFFSTGTAYCTGIGEKVRSMPPLQISINCIVKPDYGLATPLIFRMLDLNRCSTKDPEEILEGFYQQNPFFHNDLEEPAMKAAPSLVDLKEKLLSGGFKHVLLSGSGTAFFCSGEGQTPLLPGHSMYLVSAIRRTLDGWY